MNNTLIENLNAMMEVKKDLNQVLRNNGVDGGPVFDTYPDKFRELFRILEDTIGNIEEGPYANHETVTNVANPVITYKDNIVYIACATPGAQIYMRKDYEGWQQYILNFYITHDTYVESYAILNGVRSSTVSLLVPYQKTSFIDPPTIIRENGVVTITHQNENAVIWWRIYPTSYVRYTGPVNVSDTKTIVAYASYTGMASEEVWSEGTGSEITVADPVLSCTDNYVSMTCATDGAVIYYKIYGTSDWIQYTSPIEISVDTIFEAYAYKDGNISNTVTYTAEYEEPYIPPVVVPADPVFGIYNNNVSITCSTNGATIYYRKQGDVNWSIYSGSINISENTVFEAYAELNGETSNTVTYSAIYVPPVVIPANPVFSMNNNVVTITCSTQGATIMYSTDNGSTYSVYTSSISISEDTEFYAHSILNGTSSSDVYYYADYQAPVAPDVPVITYNWNTIYISCTTTGATIQYQYQGESTWHTYTSMIEISSDTVIRARSYKDGLYSTETAWVTCTYDSNYSNQPLTFNITSDGNIVWKKYDSSASSKTIYYSKTNGYTWEQLTSWTGSEARSFSVSNGDKVVFKGIQNTYGANSYLYYSGFGDSTCSFNVKGNIMSMIYGDNFVNKYSLPNDGSTFYGMFCGCNISNASNLVLPATTLAEECYMAMFENCSNLTAPPSLPATTLAESCYQAIFAGTAITSFTLPTATLARGCYAAMFADCASLTSAPALNQTTLVRNCYERMFDGCTSLVNPPSLPSTNLAPGCYMGMFSGCTSLTSAPSLPATTLRWSCYSSMFEGCSSLVNVPATLPATWSGPLVDADDDTEYGSASAYWRMFYGCNSLVTAPEIKLEQIGHAVCYEMFTGCSSLRNVKCMATAIGYRGTYNWLNGVSNNGTFTKKTGATQWVNGTDGIPYGWTVQEVSS